MIINYDHNPALTTDQKLQSLKESVQMALNENDDEHNNLKDNMTKVLADIKAALGKYYKKSEIADFVVEQGTSGNWAYRKWNSGIAECWMKYTEPSSAAFTQTGSVYYRVISGFNFPSNLFISTPTITATVDFGNVGGCSVGNPSSTTCSVIVLSAVASARACTVNIYAIGKWK